MAKLDVITIGHSSVDLYGQQVGGRLEDMGSFRKYVGGSPTNMAIGAARLGLIERIYEIGVRPDWWKLEPMTTDTAWAGTCAAAARHDLVKGFAVGRTIFADAAQGWLRGELDDTAAVATMADRFQRLCGLWDEARAKAQARKGDAA